MGYLSHKKAIAGLLLGAGAHMAAAAAAPATAAPSLKDAQINGRGDCCTFRNASAASEYKANCSTIILSDITVPAGETLDLSDLNDNTYVEFQGTTTFEYDEWKGPLVRFSGSGLTITGADGHSLDGNGARWWDSEGSNGGVTKPKFFAAHNLTNSTISGLNIKNTPVQCFSVNGAKDLVIENVTIDNSDGDETTTDGHTIGHNTDAFDVGSSKGVTIQGATVYNQDDCLAVNSGENITFTGCTCIGGHGLSIGSVGGRKDNKVSNVIISDTTVIDSQNGIRIKTVYNATGKVSNITYSGITLFGIVKYGIVIEQDYENGSPTGEPTTGVPITGLTISNVFGYVDDDAAQVYILCGDGSCSDWSWTDIFIVGGEASDFCSGVPDGASC